MNGEHSPPIRERHVDDLIETLDPGIAHQNVDSPNRVTAASTPRSTSASSVTSILCDRTRRAAQSGAAAGRIEIDRDADSGASPHQCAGDLRADPARAPRYDCALPVSCTIAR
jgi:hypothetical protein